MVLKKFIGFEKPIYYRYSIVRMYYAYESEMYESIAEFRINVIARSKLKDSRELFRLFDYSLAKMEWAFKSMMISILKKKIYWLVEGKEDGEKVDFSDVLRDFKTTGFYKYEFDLPFRYARFFDKDKLVKKEYNEKLIREIEKERSKIKTRYTAKQLLPFILTDKMKWGIIDFKTYLELKMLLGIE